MPYNLVSTHRSLRPVKYPKAYRQHQDRVNHLLWLSICSHHLPHADPPLSNMNHHHSALNNLHRYSHGTNAIRYCRTTLQPQILLLTRLLFLKVESNRNLTMRYTTRRSNVCKRTSISTSRLSYNTSLKQMISLDALQDYQEWTYRNTFGVYKTCGPPTPGTRLHGHNS